MDYRNVHRNMDINWPRLDPLESKLNMYERQIDQLFEHMYQCQDDIKRLIREDGIDKINDIQNKQHNELNELKICIQNYYQLELDNKRRMLNHECYQFQLFIVQLFIICYLIYLRFQ
jgi:hypothetical protein